jgi:hypothetical protein
MPGWILLVGVGILTAYAVSLVGPAPKPVALSPQAQAQLQQAAEAAAAAQAASQAATQALQAQQAQVPSGIPAPTASVSGVLVWRGEVTQDGGQIVYDARGQSHVVYGVSS